MSFNWRTIKRYLPEILTGVAVIGIPLGDWFLIKGTKEENKKEKILGGTIHVGSAVAIITSNRLSSTEKAGLMVASAASALKFSDYRNAVKETVEPETFTAIEQKFSEDEIERLIIEADEADELVDCVHKKRVYYYPQLRRMIQANPDTVDVALLNLNTGYQLYGRGSIANYFNWIDAKLVDPTTDYDFGWLTYDEDPECGFTQVTINQYTKPTRSGVEVTYIWFMEQPLKFEEWEAYYDAMFKEIEESKNEREYYREVTSNLR